MAEFLSTALRFHAIEDFVCEKWARGLRVTKIMCNFALPFYAGHRMLP